MHDLQTLFLSNISQNRLCKILKPPILQKTARRIPASVQKFGFISNEIWHIHYFNFTT